MKETLTDAERKKWEATILAFHKDLVESNAFEKVVYRDMPGEGRSDGKGPKNA